MSSDQINLVIQEKIEENKYEFLDLEEVKLNKYASLILLIKALSTLPFYLVGLYEPFYIPEYSWILYMEAFHHFHARIFFLLTIYRCLLQIYFSILSNGFYQRRFIILEVLFDLSIILLYLHENYSLHNITIIFSNFFIFYVGNTCMSICTLLLTSYTKIDHVV